MPLVNTNEFDAVALLLQHGKSSDFDALCRRHASEIKAVARATARIQKFAPDVEVSPYLNRALSVLYAHDQLESSPGALAA